MAEEQIVFPLFGVNKTVFKTNESQEWWSEWIVCYYFVFVQKRIIIKTKKEGEGLEDYNCFYKPGVGK